MTELTASSLRDLAEAFEAFNAQAETLRASHARLEGEVARLKQDLAHKNRLLARKERLTLLGEMAAGVAHEIRNPLGGIQLYADLIGRSLPEDGPAAVQLSKLKGGIRHLDRIVEDLLLYTREIELRRAPCRLDRVVEEALGYARPDVEAAGVEVDRRYGSRPVEVEADGGLLTRVVLNLVKNAVGAMPGGGRLSLAVGDGAGGPFTIEVSDSGAGIAPDVLEKIFHPFFSARPGGTGLGLSICHRIVDAHGGSIDVESEPGVGTTFRVEIP